MEGITHYLFYHLAATDNSLTPPLFPAGLLWPHTLLGELVILGESGAAPHPRQLRSSGGWGGSGSRLKGAKGEAGGSGGHSIKRALESTVIRNLELFQVQGEITGHDSKEGWRYMENGSDRARVEIAYHLGSPSGCCKGS